MSTEPFYSLLNQNLKNLSKQEKILLEGEIFLILFEQLKKEYSIKSSNDSKVAINYKEQPMLEYQLLKSILNDLIRSEAYTIEGIAAYTNTPADVIYDIFLGINQNPSISLFRKTLDLHKSFRPELYGAIIKKLLEPKLTENE